MIELSRRLERAGVAALDISGGSNESPQLSKYCIQPPSFPRGCLAPYSKPIKQAVSIPVLVALPGIAVAATPEVSNGEPS